MRIICVVKKTVGIDGRKPKNPRRAWCRSAICPRRAWYRSAIGPKRIIWNHFRYGLQGWHDILRGVLTIILGR
jgi:hypothetical protein